ncbi:GumC family protein [Methylosinus sporium]|uniref:GumC family protein n=1 Tax=Methylosinus sporium TaxID=428 RepID=UPI00383BC765
MHEAGEDISREDAIDLRELREFFRRHRWLIPFTALTMMGLAYFVALAITPKYTSTAKILLQPHRENLFGGEAVLKDLSVETSSVDSQILLVSSVNVLRRVVEAEQLTEDPEFGGPGKAGIVDTVLEFIGLGSKSEGEQPRTGQRFANPIPPKLLRTINRLEKALEVQRVNRTLVLAVSVTSEDREKAAHLANAIASAYVGDQLDASYEGIKRGSTWLSERLDGLTTQLQKSEEAVALFRKQHNLLSANSSDKSTVSEQQLSELNQKLIEVRAESAEKFAKFKQAAEKVSRGENLEAIPEVVRSNLISDLRKQQAEVSRKEADLAAHRGDRHPLVIDARAERRQIDRAIDAEIKRILANLKNDYNIAHAREVSLEKSLTEVTTQTGLDSETGVRLAEGVMQRQTKRHSISAAALLTLLTCSSALLAAPAKQPAPASNAHAPVNMSRQNDRDERPQNNNSDRGRPRQVDIRSHREHDHHDRFRHFEHHAWLHHHCERERHDHRHCASPN